MTKFKGLGKGLDVLFAQAQVNSSQVLNDNTSEVVELNLSKLVAGKYQPRRIFKDEELEELAQSIKSNGVIQPIIVRKINEQQYEIIAGERRYRASKLAAKKTIPAIVANYNDKETLAISLIENIQRQDLNIVEEALGYQRLAAEFDLTHDELSVITGKSRSNISNTLRLLKLESEVLDLLSNGELDMGHARALLGLDSSTQIEIANKIILEKLTTAETENLVSSIKNQSKLVMPKKLTKSIKKDVNIQALENEISDRLAMSVFIKHKKTGAGKLEIIYNDLDELDNLLEIFKLEKGV